MPKAAEKIGSVRIIIDSCKSSQNSRIIHIYSSNLVNNGELMAGTEGRGQVQRVEGKYIG